MSEQEEVVLFDDDPEMDVYNLSFDESQQRIVHARRKKLLDDHTSPAHIEGRVIVPDVRRHPISISEALKAYVESIRLIVKFLIIENQRMTKDLQEVMKRTKKSVGSAMGEMKKEILVEI